MYFKKYEKQVINPFVIYCDFETILENNNIEDLKRDVSDFIKDNKENLENDYINTLKMLI